MVLGTPVIYINKKASASYVRNLASDGQYEELKKYVNNFTIEKLKEKRELLTSEKDSLFNRILKYL